MNRGLARRPLFEDRVDIRYFLSRVAREVRRGRLEVHAWCVLTTHFHLLVRSPIGELSEALRRSQNEYSRFFNRRHRRDGTLVRGRFLSKPVQSLNYRRILVTYIDRNPVQARLVARPWLYPYGSAAQYIHGEGPAWLERSWVEEAVRSALGRSSYRAGDYAAVFGRGGSPGASRLVERRITTGRGGPDELDNLIDAAPKRVSEWLRRKASLADGVGIGLAVCDARTVQVVLNLFKTRHGDWNGSRTGDVRDLWRIAEVAMLRSLTGMPWREIARTCQASLSGCQRRFGLHGTLLEENPVYASRVGAMTSEAVHRCCTEPHQFYPHPP